MTAPQLEQFRDWIREHEPDAYSRYLRFGNVDEVDEPDPVEDSQLGLGMIGGIGDAAAFGVYAIGRLVRLGWARFRGAH